MTPRGGAGGGGGEGVREALLSFRDKRGHFPNCGHRHWTGTYDNFHGHKAGVECPSDYPCGGEGAVPGEGSPCSAKCLAANRALELVLSEQLGMAL